jgi:hypothetical protein
MKKYINYIIILFFGAALFTACEDEVTVEDERLEYGDAPTFQEAITTSNVEDSTFKITFQPSVKGYIFYVVQDSAQDDPTQTDVINSGNKLEVEYPDSAYTVQPKALAPTHVYEIFAFHANEEGVGTMHDRVLVKTTDTYAPVLQGTVPAISLDGYFEPYNSGYPASDPIYMTFNEPVVYNSNYDVTITSRGGYSETVSADNIIADSSVVTIKHDTLPYQDLIFVSVDSAAFHDGKGNNWAGVESYISFPNVYGFFYGTAPNPDHVLDSIFGNFSGKYLSKSFDPSPDSSNLLHEDTVNLTQSTEDGYIVTVNDFNGMEGSSVDLEFKEQGDYKYLTCREQSINDTLYVESANELFVDNGKWNPTTYTFNIDLVVKRQDNGALVEEVHNEYIPISSKSQLIEFRDMRGVPYRTYLME